MKYNFIITRDNDKTTREIIDEDIICKQYGSLTNFLNEKTRSILEEESNDINNLYIVNEEDEINSDGLFKHIKEYKCNYIFDYSSHDFFIIIFIFPIFENYPLIFTSRIEEAEFLADNKVIFHSEVICNNEIELIEAFNDFSNSLKLIDEDSTKDISVENLRCFYYNKTTSENNRDDMTLIKFYLGTYVVMDKKAYTDMCLSNE